MPGDLRRTAQAVSAYLACYTHRAAISNSRLIALDKAGVAFKWKDFWIKGRDRIRTMTLDAAEFIRRFLQHVMFIGRPGQSYSDIILRPVKGRAEK